MELCEIAHLIGVQGQLDDPLGRVEPRGVSIDSRRIDPGELFFAIEGPTHDGHDFVIEALQKGACAAVVSKEINYLQFSLPHRRLLTVPDTLLALQTLARRVREQWGGPVIAITGSSGKTQTKELTAQVLSASGARVIKTRGNYNNAYGLPLSLLQLMSPEVEPSEIDFVVLEMGMSAAGEIAHLCSIARPDVGLITNVSGVHLEFFPNLEAVAEAKAELVDHIKDGGTIILNLDDPLVARMRFRRLISAHTFGLDNPVDVTALEISYHGLDGAEFQLKTPQGTTIVQLPLMGRYNVYNALGAATVAEHFDLPLEQVAEGLSQATPLPMRGEVIRFSRGFTLINDAYNSNPHALQAVVDSMCATNGVKRRIVVAGEMLELGERAPELHRECGRQMAKRGVDIIIGVRGLAEEIVAGAREAAIGSQYMRFFETPEAAAHLLFDNLQDGDLILVKGSRGVRMERLVAALKCQYETSG